MKRGFTLVELLATIVILAIVSLITIPIITGVINKTRLNSLKSSAYGLLEASNLYMAQYQIDKNIRFDINNNNITSNDTNDLLKYKGTIKEGTVILNEKGKVTICITDGVNSAYKNYNELKVTLVSKNKCYVPNNTSIVYLEKDGRTVEELTNIELTNEIAALKEEIASLKSSKADKKDLTSKDDIYPVGSIYMSMNNTNPSTLFGGTWEQIQSGKMLQSTTTNSGVTGGQASVSYTPSGSVGGTALTVAQIPAHTHGSRTATGGVTAHIEEIALNGGGSGTTGWGVFTTATFQTLKRVVNSDHTGVATVNQSKADFNYTHEHDSVGGNQAHNHSFTGTPTSIATMPPYITVFMWKRTA